jgi:hypothetical protein
LIQTHFDDRCHVAQRIHRRFMEDDYFSICRGSAVLCEVRMKTSLLIVLALAMIGVGGALAAMKNACKGRYRTWCAPTSDVRHPAETPT